MIDWIEPLAWEFFKVNLSRSEAPEIRLVLASEEHSQWIWEWRNDPVTREMSMTQEFIPWEAHQSWFQNSLENPHRKILISLIQEAGEWKPLAMTRFDIEVEGEEPLTPQAEQELGAEISINLNPQFRGRKLAQRVLMKSVAYGFNQLGFHHVTARIQLKNQPSLKLFFNSGFFETHRNEHLFFCRRNNDHPAQGWAGEE